MGVSATITRAGFCNGVMAGVGAMVPNRRMVGLAVPGVAGDSGGTKGSVAVGLPGSTGAVAVASLAQARAPRTKNKATMKTLAGGCN